MDRRKFVGAAAGSLLVAPLACAAPPPGKVFRIGTLSVITINNVTFASVLLPLLGERGYVVDRNIVFVERSADGNVDRLPSLAAELVALKVDLIVAGAAVAIRAARDATATIPIVMAFSAGDPVRGGFVKSLASPGGNVTGVTALSSELGPKLLELLRDVTPAATRIAILSNPNRLEHSEYVDMLQAARPREVQLHTVEARDPEQYDAAFATMTREHAHAVIILGDVIFTRDAGRLAALALAHRLASVYLFRAFVEAGGLLAYGPDELQLIKVAAQYIEKILNGTSPGSLPVQQPTLFRLAVNLKTAAALNIIVPRSVMLRADEVIR
jgi:putative ABC transport system substrate-binding protein